MQLWSRMRSKVGRFTPVRLTRVEVAYVGSFTLRVLDADHVELAWSTKTETVLTDRGEVWSETEFNGPGIDRLLVEVSTVPATLASDIVISYPVSLTKERGTLRTTGPGVIRQVTAEEPEPARTPEPRRS